MRKELEETREHSARSERGVRQIVADINQRIRDVNRTAFERSTVDRLPLDEEAPFANGTTPKHQKIRSRVHTPPRSGVCEPGRFPRRFGAPAGP
jgi:hypothetical protein